MSKVKQYYMWQLLRLVPISFLIIGIMIGFYYISYERIERIEIANDEVKTSLVQLQDITITFIKSASLVIKNGT